MLDDLCRDSGMAPALGKSYLILTQSLSNCSLYQLEHCEQVRPIQQSTAQPPNHVEASVLSRKYVRIVFRLWRRLSPPRRSTEHTDALWTVIENSPHQQTALDLMIARLPDAKTNLAGHSICRTGF